jgi:membrane associated rhomboid family serine protease
LNVIVFFHELGLGGGLERFIEAFGVVPAQFTHWVELGGDPVSIWRFVPLFSSMFLHGGWAHIAGNMLFLWIFGDNVEDVLGRFRFVIFYLLCGVTAALAQIVVSPNSEIPTIGASGAIAGILGAYFITFPRARVVTFIPIFILPYFVEIPAVVFLGIWFVMQLFHGLSDLGAVTTAHGGIAWWAHASGFLTGIVLMLLMRPAQTSLRYRRATVW